MIKVDESDPVGELEPSFPYKDITIRRGVDMKDHYELQSEIGRSYQQNGPYRYMEVVLAAELLSGQPKLRSYLQVMQLYIPDELIRGKFGTVFKCREKATSLMLAAKFVGIAHKQDRRNAEREVEIMCELQHPRLIQLYDAFEANNAMCFVLELVEGGELFERVIGDDFVLTEKAVTIFMRQICEGVQFIHSKNILHLDLKPENILCLTKTGNRVKIIDFGLARKFNPDNKLQVLFGTPEFVAPEVVNFDAIGFGTDMWSVGVICYVLLSGLSPFMGETDVETMANVTVAQYDFDDEAFDSISNDAKDFIKKLLVKDHKSRPSATECLLHRWMQKKKPKRTVQRKNSSKCSAKQTGEKTKRTAAAAAPVQDVLQPLDVSKENLRELCSRSRSQSPAEIGTAVQTPSLAQLRIQRDSKSSKASCNDDCSRPPPTDEPRTPDEPSGASPTAAVGTKTSAGGTNASERVAGGAAADMDPLGRFSPEATAQSATVSGGQKSFAAAANDTQPLTDGPKTDAGGEPRSTASPDRSRSCAFESAAAASGTTSVSDAEVSRSRATLTATNSSSSYRRSSDVSYMFSSFRSCTTTVQSSSSSSSSGLLQQQQQGSSDLRGLSERLLKLSSRGCGEKLHALLQLQTAVDRRPKFKFTSRDVPVGSAPPASNLMYYMTSACRSAPHSERASPEHESITAKEMLLKLFYGDANVEPKLQSI